jgi:Protein of unknown function (DUF433)
MLGKPVFKGTRLTVEHVLRELGTGMTQEQLLDNILIASCMRNIAASPVLSRASKITARKQRVNDRSGRLADRSSDQPIRCARPNSATG